MIFHFHKSASTRLVVKPYLEDVDRGVFATRAPCRPNHLGQSLVRLLRREGATLYIEDVDMLDGTPVLDIKPFAARFDNREDTCDGWHRGVDDDTAQRRGTRRET